MTRVALVIMACAGCESILGIDETRYTGMTDAATDARAPDACGLACEGSFASCRALKMQYPNAPSGVYVIDTGTVIFRAYCEQTGDGGGWTLALKVDGRLTTFNYDNAIWEDTTLLGTDTPNLDHSEAKLETWSSIAFTEMRVGLEYPIDTGTVNWLVVPLSGARLYDLFQPNQGQTTTLGRDAWKSLLSTYASLQPNCNMEGTNVYDSNARVRIGIISNQEADCLTPDSRIGIGGGGTTCGGTETAGDTACFTPDNGDVELAAFGWVLVR